MTKEQKRRQRIIKSIRLVWSSLEAHFPYINSEKTIKELGTPRFNIKCVREYAEIIKTLTENI